MSYTAWPSPDSPRGPLPRIEDLPIAEQGYDQEAVREAFDSFYRHAAQLDVSLRALEGVEAFRRDALELRGDLRSLRSLGFGDRPSWTPSYLYEPRARPALPPAVPRLAAEAALVIAVAVVAGVAHFRTWLIVALMAAAWAIVAASEWIAARARFRLPTPAYDVAGELALEPAPYVEPPAPDAGVGWPAFQEQAEEPEALTMVGQALEAAGGNVVPEDEAPEPEDQPGPDVAPAAADEAPEPEEEPEPGKAAEASPVRVLPTGEAGADPWEQGFDRGSPEPEAEPEAQLAQRGGRIRRRRR